MTRPAISVQLYSVRNELAKNMESTLRRLAEIGFTAVEPFGLPVNAAELKSALLSASLKAPTAHGNVLIGPEAALSAAVEIGVSTLIDPYQPEERFQNESELKRLADELSNAAELGKKYGIAVGYHNHDHEIRNEIAGVPALLALAEQTSAEVVFEVDLFWCQVANADVVEILDALKGRVVALHVKDAPLGSGTENQVPAGTGDVPILESLKKVPNARPVLEFDEYSGDIFEALASGFEFLKENGVES
jgi:sugar phosphate isomerase/epimerase